MLRDEIHAIPQTKKNLREFGLLVGGVFVILGGLLYYFEKSSFPYFLTIGLLLFLFGAAMPRVLKPLHKIWMTLAILMGWVVTRLILVLLFYIVVTPIALLARLFGKRFLALRPNPTLNTYWEHRAPEAFDPQKYKNQF